MKFEGFSPETMDFLWGIRFNNNREWFTEHKQQYQQTLYEPMKALAKELEPDFASVPGLRLHISRIYRDMRMHPSTFYKDSLWFCFRRDGGAWLEHPCLCFEVRPEGYRYGFLLLYGKTNVMQALRQKMSENADSFLKMVKKAEKDSGLTLDGEHYVRPKPCGDERLKKYFGLKNFLALRDAPPDELLFTPALVDELRKVLLAWLPVSEFMQIENL